MIVQEALGGTGRRLEAVKDSLSEESTRQLTKDDAGVFFRDGDSVNVYGTEMLGK